MRFNELIFYPDAAVQISSYAVWSYAVLVIMKTYAVLVIMKISSYAVWLVPSTGIWVLNLLQVRIRY
eukprot:SAG11_NODE_5072_length_1672_cov_7.991736_1_plen_67_part_00